MKTLKMIIAVFGFVTMFYACAPSDEDVQPNLSDKDLEQFDVENTEGGSNGIVAEEDEDE